MTTAAKKNRFIKVDARITENLTKGFTAEGACTI